MVTLVCAYGTTVLTNCEPSKLVLECIFCALQERTQMVDVHTWDSMVYYA